MDVRLLRSGACRNPLQDKRASSGNRLERVAREDTTVPDTMNCVRRWGFWGVPPLRGEGRRGTLNDGEVGGYSVP